MKADGKAVIIITHKLHEVLGISDRVAILRKGEYVGDVATRDADEATLTAMMVGEKVELNIERPEPVNPVKRLDIQHLTVRSADGITALDDVSFDVYGGEISGHCRYLRQRPEGTAGGHRRPAAHPARRQRGVLRSRHCRTPVQLIGKSPKAIQEAGVPPVLRAGGPAGHGSGRLHGHDGQHDAEKLRQGPCAHLLDRKAPHDLAES